MPHSPRASDLRRSRAPVGGGGNAKTNKTFLRLSSSLQDLSSYSQLDLEDGPTAAKDHHRPLRPSAAPVLTDAPSFSKDKPSPTSSFLPQLPHRRKCAGAAVLALCLFSLFFLVYVCALYVVEYRSRGSSSYYVVMDCGSTGTRVYVYESRVSDGSGKKGGGVELPISLRPLPEAEEMERRSAGSPSGRAYRRMETEPGLDKLVRNETGLRAAIVPLVRWAEKQIPGDFHGRTYVYLYATAGVRRLPSADSEWVLDKAFEILRKTTNFVCRKSWVKTISGMEEAYFGWIALNYNMRILGSAKETLGALDLGGSSLQVTFENEEAGTDESSLSLHIGSVYHHLIAYSLSGYGLNDAFDKSVAHLLKWLPANATMEGMVEDGSRRLEVRHPCLNNGYRERYACSHCAGVVAQGGTPTSESMMGSRGGGSRKAVPVELVGTSHWENCSALAKSTVNLSVWSAASGDAIDCDIRPCALVGNRPRPRGRFYAMSGFFVVFRFFNLSAGATLDDMLQKGQEFCEKTWEDAKNSVLPQPFIEQYCFRAPYVASLLRDGLHIGDSEVVIGSGSITWTLGVALLEAGQTFLKRLTLANYIMVPGSIDPMILVFALLMSLLFLCAISIANKQLRNAFRRTYLPLFRRSSGTGAFQYFNSGDARTKTPLSPTVAGTEQSPFIMPTVRGLGGNSVQLAESTAHPSTVGVLHSYSYSNLSQIYFDNGKGSSWAPHRNKTQLWSRRSQSREDLSALMENHMVKG